MGSLDTAAKLLSSGDRAGALRETVGSLAHLRGGERARAYHQAAVLIDDHPLPTHDETAWRCSVAAYRISPDTDLYATEAVRRTLLKSAYLQLPRSIANVFLYAALVMINAAKRWRPLLVLAVPLSLPFLLPGVALHALNNYLLVPSAVLILGRRTRKQLLARNADDALESDLNAAISALGEPAPA